MTERTGSMENATMARLHEKWQVTRRLHRGVRCRSSHLYTPSLCNHPHEMATGIPVEHECYVIPVKLLGAWRERGL